jgi:L-ribulose-5-phosphate 3-epimerase
MTNRREFLNASSAVAGAATFAPSLVAATATATKEPRAPWFRISLAEWSLNQRLFGGQMTNLDFPVMARKEFGIDVVEYVNQFFKDKAEDAAYLASLRQRCDDNGVKSGLIMCDGEGALGDPDSAARTRAIENHYKWVTAAAYLGCHSIRVNAQSSGNFGAQLDFAVDGLQRLAEFGAKHKMNVIVENHGGLSSNGKWLASVISQVGLPNCGTLPDFGNFNVAPDKPYDRYLGVAELMPYAKGVSAKTYGFDVKGNETTIDYVRMMRIVKDAGYSGYVGIEWEGKAPDEIQGIKQTKALLERVRNQQGV